MRTCFIIAPITTPESLVTLYGSDSDHFKHVLEHLLIPAIERADFSPITPIASGSDLIHAEIIKNLESSDLVICDMSTLNANVFFELGIRTAVDKPVCLIKDSYTQKVPFDTGVLNYHIYDPTLTPWKLNNEIVNLVDHITKSINRSQGRNTLWRHFGLTTRAELVSPESPTDEKLSLILARLDSLEQNNPPIISASTIKKSSVEKNLRQFLKDANEIASKSSAVFSLASFDESNKEVVLDLGGFLLMQDTISQVQSIGTKYGFSVKIIHKSISDIMNSKRKK